jgi:hypothetical protein
MCAYPNPENAFLGLIQGKIGFLKLQKTTNFASKTQFFPESGSGKHFQGSGMHAIDSPHKITPRGVIFRTIRFRIPKNHKNPLFLAHPVHDFGIGKFFLKKTHMGLTCAGNQLRAFSKHGNASLT